MKATVELSLYPISDQPIEKIADFIERVQSYSELTIKVNALSTQVAGELSAIMQMLEHELPKTWNAHGQAPLVAKFLSGDLLND